MKKLFAGIVAVAAAGALAARAYYEERNFVTEYYDISSKKIPSDFDGYRMVMLSDLHNYAFDKDNKALIKRIEELDPDVIMIAGDMIDAKPGASMDTAILTINQLCMRWPVCMANGNHEQRIVLYPEVYADMARRWRRGIKHKNLMLLRNRHILLVGEKGGRLNIYGLEIDRSYYKRFKGRPMSKHYLDGVLGQAEDDVFNIMIAHNPQYFDVYADWGADLVMSGHVHGGVMILPFLGGVISPQVRIFPKYYAGLYNKGKSSMILSRGLHMHSIPVRLNNMPELSCIDLHRVI